MAKLRPRQFEPSKTGAPFKLGFDGEEDGWVFVKKQRIIIVLPSLPPPDPFTFDKPAITSQLEAELIDGVAEAQESTFVHTVVPEHFILHKPETSQSQAKSRDVAVVDTHKTTHVPSVVPSPPLPEQVILHKPETHETTPLHTVVPSRPITEHFILKKPATSQSQTEFRDFIVDSHETTPLHTVVSSLPLSEHFILQKPATSPLQPELRSDIHETTPLHTVVPSLPVPEHYTLQKPASSQSQAESRADTRKATLVHTVVPSFSVTEHCALQNSATSQSKAESRTETHKGNPVHTVIPSLPVLEHYTLPKLSTAQSQAELRVATRKATLAHTMVPSLPVPERFTLQKPAESQSEVMRRDLVAVTHVHTVEPEACPDFTSVDKPEKVMGRNPTTRKAPAPRRSLQDFRMNPDRRVETHRSRTGYKPIRFPRVMCSSVVMDNEKLRVLNLEKKFKKAGGLNKWVGSIGLGREFERMLRGQRMSKFQMANLTMEKLKQMGALAVGPRRKLIHAIGCVYHPHCLRASFN